MQNCPGLLDELASVCAEALRGYARLPYKLAVPTLNRLPRLSAFSR
jgi:hypothetical protein